MGCEAGVAKDCQQPPQVGRDIEGNPYRFQRGHGPTDTLISTSSSRM